MGTLLSTPVDTPLAPGDILRDIYVLSRPLESSQNSKRPEAVLAQGRPLAIFHWGVRVGDLVYELEKSETSVVTYRHFAFAEREWSTEYRVGGTILTDEKLAAKGHSVLSRMSPKYDAILNNCQNFVMKFLADIVHGPIDKQRLSSLELDSICETAMMWDPLERMGRQILLTDYMAN
ncbi:hypothetical protein C8R44DRAFT_768460 [Mycena epipterygia]|nr:hypothetical protein C8R44DRAFT_768460 [Mycena epipterygia]